MWHVQGFSSGGVPESYGALPAECSSLASETLPKPAMAGEWSLAKRGAVKKHGETVVATQLFLGNQALYTLGKWFPVWLAHIFQLRLVETTNHSYMHPLKPNGWNLKKGPPWKKETHLLSTNCWVPCSLNVVFGGLHIWRDRNIRMELQIVKCEADRMKYSASRLSTFVNDCHNLQ